jgi:predicted DNA-binding protein
VTTQNAILDSDASRDFKAIRLPFNEYEYRQLEEASRRTGRSKLNFIRYAMLKMAAETNENI